MLLVAEYGMPLQRATVQYANCCSCHLRGLWVSWQVVH
jgi:hypothetical protein